MTAQSALTDPPAETLARADAIADRAVEEEGPGLVAAFASGDVAEIERTFYRVFRRIYLSGVSDGLNEP